MTEERRLGVSSNGRAVGTLIEQDDIWAFEYEDAWRLAPDAFPLSPALPLAEKRHRDGSTRRSVQWYFDNLLPEEQLREVLSQEQGVHASDAFGLLERLGAESAGSLVLLPPGSPEAEPGDQPLADEDLSGRIRNLTRASMTSKSPKRMSLAGAQHKMVVLFDPATGRLREPWRGSASSHILKPNGQSDQYPHSVVNETFTMRLAHRLGLNVPTVYRRYVPEPVYIVARFDREWNTNTQAWQRKHVLDACQLLDQPRSFKYSNANLSTLLHVIATCRMKAAARMALFKWMLFNTLVGNSDSHLKNISFFMDHEGVQVAPFYDLLCTAVYHARMYAGDAAVWPHEPLTIPIVDAGMFADVTREKLVKTGVALGLGAAAASREVAKMVSNLPVAADQLIADMAQEFAGMAASANPQDIHLGAQPDTLPDALRATQGAEAHLLRGVRNIVIADMLRQVG